MASCVISLTQLLPAGSRLSWAMRPRIPALPSRRHGHKRAGPPPAAWGAPPPRGAVAGVETCSEGVPQLYMLHGAGKPRRGDTGRGAEAGANVPHLERGVHGTSRAGAGAQGAWRRVVPGVAEQAGGNAPVLGPVITPLGFITKTIEDH